MIRTYVTRWLANRARHSHVVQEQAALAMLHGLISIFGVTKAVLIYVAIRRQIKGKVNVSVPLGQSGGVRRSR
jgi:hypothetical protein